MWLICWSAVGEGGGQKCPVISEIRFMRLSSYSTPKIRGRLVIVNVNSSLLFCELFPIYTLALSADAKSAKIEDCILHKQMVTNFICLNLF